MKSLTLFLLLLTIVGAHLAAAGEPVALKDLVGSYYFGDGLGVNCNLTVAAKGAFTFEWSGCLGVYDRNEGTAGVRDGILRLAPRKTNVRKGFRGTPTEFYPVRWGPRMYLVATNQMAEFCSGFNDDDEPRSEGRHGRYYLRQTDADRPVTGKPAVPEAWSKYLLDRPVRGKIIQLVGKQEAWLDKGSADGLLVGMVLTAQQQGNLMFSRVQIEAVEKGRCRIKCRWDDSKLALGQTVSTRFHD